MGKEAIREALADAYHAIGHAYADIGGDRPIAASTEIGRAFTMLEFARDGIDKIFAAKDAKEGK